MLYFVMFNFFIETTPVQEKDTNVNLKQLQDQCKSQDEEVSYNPFCWFYCLVRCTMKQNLSCAVVNNPANQNYGCEEIIKYTLRVLKKSV